MTPKTWFLTGTSRGFGREWAIAALDRGDLVAATARNISSLDDLAASYGDAVRHVPRLPMGARGAEPGTGPGGSRLRYQGDADRARRLRDRLGRLLSAACNAAAGL